MACKWTEELERIASSAQRDASKMHVRLNTALLLRSMLKNSGVCRDLLAHTGLSLASIERALRVLYLYASKPEVSALHKLVDVISHPDSYHLNKNVMCL